MRNSKTLTPQTEPAAAGSTPSAGSGLRDPITDPLPGDVWRIGDTEGIILKVEPGTVIATHARCRDGRWQQATAEEVGVMALWHMSVPFDDFKKAASTGHLLQRSDDLQNTKVSDLPEERKEHNEH